MGIKGIYKEIGPGKRISLCKLAVDHLEKTGQPLRIAIDFAIWSFQAQAARGGSNPAIRTLFYRLVRLLSLTITPIFIFDGPNKPAFKRGKRSRGPGDTVSVAMAKRLFKLFGFAIHDAPGEAEAECALLQQQGVVDAVLSEDVDTIMFGCTRTLRNWSAEGTRAAKTPTHVSLYDVEDLRQSETGLDREGMVLVALMSGGDYIPEGVPGCGVKVACEAAKAGFGKRLCRIKRSDPEALQKWRQELMRELRTNESKFFRVKHKALTIPADFPDVEVLRYYTHPVVSQAATIERLRREFPLKKEIDIAGLREFTAETFDWTFKIGAIKFIRVFAAGLLVQGLMDLSSQELGSDDPDVRERVESKLVKSIKSTRAHFSTDATPELRVSFIPVDIVGLDLDAEEDEVASTYGRSGLALNSDDEEEDQLKDEEEQSRSGPKKVFDPLQPDLAWVPETVAKLGVPLLVEDWEARQRTKQLSKDNKSPVKHSRKKASDMPAGALDRYVKSTQPNSTAIRKYPDVPASSLSASHPPSTILPASQQVRPDSTSSDARNDASTTHVPVRRKQSKTLRAKEKAPSSRPSLDVNPWTIASSQTTPRVPRTKSISEDRPPPPDAIFISSSPVAPSPPPATAVAAVDSDDSLLVRSLVLQPADENSQRRSFLDDPFSPASNSAPVGTPADTTLSRPRKHNYNLADPVKPAAKRAQKTRAARDSSPTRRKATRAGRAAQITAQSSIKSFGRPSEAMAKKDTAAPAPVKVYSPSHDSDSDSDGLKDLCNLGRKVTHQRLLQPAVQHKSTASSNPIPAQQEGSTGVRKLSKTSRSLPIEIPSSPPPPAATSPSPFKTTSSKMTRVYIPRTSDAGLGYFKEVEVTRDEADRMIFEEAERSRRTKRPGGTRMWRQSEVSILDLTEDA